VKSGVWLRRVSSAFLLILLAPSWSASQTKGNLESETSLYYRIGERRTLVRKLQPSQVFQGTAIMRDGNIFLAYSGTGDEATTALSVYDVRTQRERIFVELGATGESRFAYDAETGLVVFDWEGALYIFPLDAARQIPANRERLDVFKRLLVLVTKCDSCFQPHWAKDGRIAYIQYDKTGAAIPRKAEVPKAPSPARGPQK
jgi:hypothetical protein